MDMNTHALGQASAQRRIGDQHLMTRLYNHLKSPSPAPLNLPAESSLASWLGLYRMAINHPVFLAWVKQTIKDLNSLILRGGVLENTGGPHLTLGDGSEWQAFAPPILEIADIIDPDAMGLPYLAPGVDALQLPAAQVLRFYGYPPPQDHGQLKLITQAMDQQASFADAALDNGLKRLNQDLHTLANTLESLLEDTDFNLYACYRTYIRLNSGSFWDNTQQAGATLLASITHSREFLALEQVQDLQPNAYTFDPINRRLSGKNAYGVLVDIGIEQLLALPLQGKLEQLIDIAGQLGTFVHQSGKFSVAQLLESHELPIPDTIDEARALIQQLRQSRPLTVLSVSDLAESDTALVHWRQWLALEQERDTTGTGLPLATLLGDYHQALNALSPQQRIRVLEVVNTWLPDTRIRLLDELSKDLLAGKTHMQIRAQAQRFIKQILNLTRARQLGQRLIAALGWYGQTADEQSNRSSVEHLVLAALILDLDPQVGKRYVIAGFDLAANAQHSPTLAALREDLELHLVRSARARADAASLAAHLLLAGCAPEFLVRAIPGHLRFMTSVEWMSLRQGVLIAQAVAPGSAQFMTYDAVIALATQDDTTAEQEQWRTYTSNTVLLDWALARGELPQRTDGTYTAEEVNTVKRRLSTRLEALKTAFTIFSGEAPTLRGLALAELKRVLPDLIDLEIECLLWTRPSQGHTGNNPPATLSFHSRYALVDLYLNGWLTPFSNRWVTDNPVLDLDRVRPFFSQLNNLDTLFDSAFSTYLQSMKYAYGITLDDLLAQLPRADRLRLERGQVQVLVLKKEANKAEALEDEDEKNARLGRFGVIVRCVQAGTIHEYELFPLLNLIHKRSARPLVFDLGGKQQSVATGMPRSAHPFSTLHLGNELAVDWLAYSIGRAPRQNVVSTAVVEQLWSNTQPSIPRSVGSSIYHDIAQAIVQGHFFLEIDAARLQARGSSLKEDVRQRADNALARLKQLVPLWSCTEDILSGDTRRMTFGAYHCLLDLFGLLFPARKYVSGLLATLRSTAPLPIKLLQLGKLTSHSLITTLNPLDAVPGLLRLSYHGLLKLNASTRQALRQAIEQMRRRSANSPLTHYARLLNRADVGIGSVLGEADFSTLAAVMRKGRWHAFDPFSARPYGPALEKFRLSTAINVTSRKYTNGYQALVTEALFDTPPLLIPHAQATDLLDQGRVLRFEHSAPSHLDELASAAYWQADTGLKNACPGARRRRSPVPLICFTKELFDFRDSIHKRRVQALEHLRVIPAPSLRGAKRQLVHNRQLFDVTPQWVTFKLTRSLTPSPVRYRALVVGKLIEDELEFGLPGDDLDTLLTRKTCVIKLHGIAEGIDDSRFLRALVIELRPPSTLIGPRWVVQADAGTFYSSTPRAPDTELSFERLDFSFGGDHERLIRTFCEEKHRYLQAGGLIPDQPLVTLPTLETLYRQLHIRGFSDQKISSLRHQASTLPPLKRRELLLHASDQGQHLDISVASRPLQLEIWPPSPAVPGGASVDQINQYLAQQAMTSTQTIVQRTGVGSANVLGPGAQELARLDTAESVVMWQYSKTGHPDYTEVILKTGAGNCDQMAHVAHEMINANGGTAHIWGTQPAAHAFVVVGTPAPGLAQTRDFSEPEFKHLWVCDPWALVVCAASDYLRRLEIKMIEWDLEDIFVLFNDQGQRRWARANDVRWRNLLNQSLKQVIR